MLEKRIDRARAKHEHAHLSNFLVVERASEAIDSNENHYNIYIQVKINA